MIHDIRNIAHRGRCEAQWDRVASFRWWSPILQTGGGREILVEQTDNRRVEICSAPQRHHHQRVVIRQVQGWGAPSRTALVIDKTPWKKRTANLRRCRRSACELDFWEVSRLKRPLTTGAKRYANWIFLSNYPWNNFTYFLTVLDSFVLLMCFFPYRCCLEMTLNLIN